MIEHEDGHCDECGCETAVAWINLAGQERCESCATGAMELSVRGASKPEARDDGR